MATQTADRVAGDMERMTGLPRAAAAESVRIRAAVEGQARKVAKLQLRLRRLRKQLRDVDDQIRTERRFLRAMIRDLGHE